MHKRESGGQCDFSPPVFPVDARREPREMRKVGYQSALWVFILRLVTLWCATFRSFSSFVI